MTNKKKQSVSLIVAGDYHDIDYVRHNLLGLLLEQPHLRTRVFENYDDLDAICEADLLISYTCNVVPNPTQVPALEKHLKSGARWLALHGTNSLLAQNENQRWYTPDTAKSFFKLLGSQFAAHPPIEPYTVHVRNQDHPVSKGLDDFVVEGGDELYYMHQFGELNVLMDAVTQGSARGFAEREWDEGERHPVLYEKTVGEGAILYFSLGHRRGHWDMEPLLDYYHKEEFGAWELPIFSEILRRSINWLQNSEGGI